MIRKPPENMDFGLEPHWRTGLLNTIQYKEYSIEDRHSQCGTLDVRYLKKMRIIYPTPKAKPNIATPNTATPQQPAHVR